MGPLPSLAARAFLLGSVSAASAGQKNWAMTRTLEEMAREWAATGAPRMPVELAEQWQEKVEEIARYIEPYLKDPARAVMVADEIVHAAWSMGRIDGDRVTVEVPPRHNRSGRVHRFTV